MAGKFDFEPLLGPGCHPMTLEKIKTRFVDTFSDESYQLRRSLYQKLEIICQELMQLQICCDVFVDGSFLTKKVAPKDLDMIISVDEDAYNSLEEKALLFLDRINMEEYISDLDAVVYVSYPRGSEHRGEWFDAREVCAGYGEEHSREWRKGYVVVRLGETNVGLRIRS